jgi:hypothetical protein
MITIGYSTRKSNPQYIEILKKSCGLKNVEVIEIVNDGIMSLPEVYNKILNESSNDIVVLCHDDLEFDTNNWGKRLLLHFENSTFGILGVAGTTEIPKSGMWWEDRNKMIGTVNHKSGGKKWESKYSKSWNKSISECCFIDGLFMSINKKKIKSFFDESISGFHFYDANFCLDNFLKNVKIGIMHNIRLTHLSIGQTNNQWEENRKIFIKKYNDKLPVKSNININYKLKDFEYMGKYNIKIIVNCSNDLEETLTLLKEIENYNILNYSLNLIINESYVEKFNFLMSERIKIYSGVFDDFSKNLSILKWEDNFVSKKDNLIFFIDRNVKLVNNIFHSLVNLFHKEKNSFGCAFATCLKEDYSIHCTKFDIIKNKENQFQVFTKNSGSYYNVMDGYFENKLGTISDVFMTTYDNLINFDWFDIQYDTGICFNDFAVRCFYKNLKCYYDTNSLVILPDLISSQNKNSDINKLLQKIMSNQKSQELIINI